MKFVVETLNAVKAKVEQPRVSNLTFNEKSLVRAPSAQGTDFGIEFFGARWFPYNNAETIVDSNQQKDYEDNSKECEHSISSCPTV